MRVVNRFLRQRVALLPAWLLRWMALARSWIFDIYATKSYSQEGEDMILARVFDSQQNGFYVDVGAHHPRRFSNTHYFYSKGWRGINIEPNPASLPLFRSQRRRDINLNVGVGLRSERLKYYVFDEPALNTFDAQLVESRLATTSYKVVGSMDVAVEPLGGILQRYLPAGGYIDFLTIDVEGLDLEVLKSNDWNAYRPRYVLVESLKTLLEDAVQSEVFGFMAEQGYRLFAKTYNTMIFSEGRK